MSERQSLAGVPLAEIMRRAHARHVLVPAFNIPYLPMVEPLAEVVKSCHSFALLEVARPDIERFQARSYRAVAQEFSRCADRAHLRLHQDHTPVVDEDGQRVAWRPPIEEALALGYDSLMIDGSRLPLEENIRVTIQVVALAHPRAAAEAELGAVLGHEAGPLPPYEELFRTGQGFTDVEEAGRFVRETGVDWLSVAIGNIHGAIQGAAKDQAKVSARLSIDHLRQLANRTGVPLVLHGGSALPWEMVRQASQHGIVKVNVALALRQAFEGALSAGKGVAAAQQAVGRAAVQHIEGYGIRGSARLLL
jgi:fructose/tagatose bisphosphate aldolase